MAAASAGASVAKAWPKEWRMRSERSPIFAEYVLLAQAGGWGDLVQKEDMDIGPSDALVIVDMQNDFIPVDALNPDGGAFGVAEGARIAPLIVELAEHFAARGAPIAACRDYHPDDHCSFLPNGGDFPSHCIQGSVGSHFYEPIGRCVQDLRSRGSKVEVVFKGFHEDVDSFGCFQYPDRPPTFERVSCRNPTKDRRRRNLHGCSLAAWTGACILRRSNREADVNAPPDVLSAHRKETLADWFKREGVRRVFACGLALDFCVMDTVLNAVEEGFREAYLLLDAARAAYLPGRGEFGSGFVQDPVALKQKMVRSRVRLAPCAAILPAGGDPASAASDPSRCDLALSAPGFPETFGPVALLQATRDLDLELDFETGRWLDRGRHAEELRRRGCEPSGSITTTFAITLDAKTRAKLGLPKEARFCTWANPADGISGISSNATAYWATTSIWASFYFCGGFLYLDESKAVVDVRAMATGQGLHFRPPQSWRGSFSEALKGRWQRVTMPYLRKTGASLFAWIHPGEELCEPSTGKRWTVCAHGAFVYLFHDDLSVSDSRDVYFEVMSFEESAVKDGIGKIAVEAQKLAPAKASAPFWARVLPCCS
eukprot:TRINITY_DN39197_c0_g1_i1.p1 TRINITY_DN39197_c0_g1~~TRINITY_DN39197_c0_g1_i1.p1  ORF type:complete len:627 (-),score=105.21 TRINITY_DN39197_c0_g1_i1:83-1882(-)